jgi:hypothetical protein
MAISWSTSLVNRVAPDLNSFNRADIPDVLNEFPEAPHWLVNFLLNTSFGARFKHPFEKIVIGYLRRAHCAARYYREARTRTLEYVDTHAPGQPRVALYYDAISDWENFSLQSAMAMELYNALSPGDRVFQKGDGSPEQRLYTIANHVKHTAKCVAAGQIAEAEMLPLWVDTTGLRSYESIAVTYTEAAGVLHDVSALADRFQNPAGLVAELTRCSVEAD